MSTVSIYIIILLAYPFIQNVSTLLHELGHALPALWLTKSERVEIYINTYGKKEGALRWSAGRLFFFWHPFRFKGYGTGLTVYSGADRHSSRYIITAGGVVFSLFTAGVLLFIVLSSTLSAFWQTLAIIFFAGAVVDLFVNLVPGTKGITLEDGQEVPNDGKKLYQLWKSHRVAVALEQVEYFIRKGQEKPALETLLELPLLELRSEELSWLLGHTASTGMLAEYPLWNEVFTRLGNKQQQGFTDWLNWGVIQGRRGQFKEALACFDEIPAQSSDEAALLISNRVFVLMEMGRTTDALALLEVLNAEEKTAYELAHHGLCLARLGRREAGWEMIKKALHLSGTDPYVLRCAGLYCLEKSGAK